MPQSAIDATRFTSTTPHVSPALNKDKFVKPPRRPGTSSETPQEKVRRLRAAVEKARLSQISILDRWIARGRVWADVAHTVTTTTLIAASVFAGGLTIYAVTDMIIYNRRKKAEYFQVQKAQQQLVLDTARKAVQDGIASEAQINIVKIEDQHQASSKNQ
ncbi:hypothetical protein OnM2_028101 [Erysiphe neolycopersici]|uniref:Uncharacterized protein n=1 Tax=Erysiphe neolycopersici TaxID=212602 RepID=A0A420I051_9PEZI|nr:hypothetical protein OnM2_028101 [Erysiphe neolycopersici]